MNIKQCGTPAHVFAESVVLQSSAALQIGVKKREIGRERERYEKREKESPQ